MTMNIVFSFSILLCLFIMTSNGQETFDVIHYGAIGDGQKDDTQAFKDVWELACSANTNNPTINVPRDMTFLVQPVQFEGPCKSSHINFEINGKVIATKEPSEWICQDECQRWIHFNKVDGLSISGTGTINGQGKKWWNHNFQQKPTAMAISESKNIRLSGLRFEDNPRVHIVLDGSMSVVVSNIMIKAPADSPNTDGIHLHHSSNISIESSVIGTGDDCISMVDGSSFIKISNITCGPGHGISIGSLGKDGATHKVENIEVRDVVFRGTTNGARIKTWQGGSGYARNIVYENIVSEESNYPINIDQFYCDNEDCKIQENAVQVQNVTFRQVQGTTKNKVGVKLDCSTTVPCKDIVIDNVHILSEENKNVEVVCSNAEGKVRGQNVPNISCLDST